MTYIPTADHRFLQRIVDESIEVGYIKRPINWNGHAYHQREMRRDGSCFICCIPCCGRIDDELAVLIGTVFFVFSSIVAFAYALRSAQSACQANQDLAEVRYGQGRAPQAPHEAVYPLYPSPSAPPYEYDQLQFGYAPHHSPSTSHLNPLNTIYRDAEILLEGRRSERTWVAVSQGAMCVGAALLTVALLTTFIVEGELLLFECGFAGAGLLSGGALLYGGTKCFHSYYAEQAAAQRISDLLYPPTTYY